MTPSERVALCGTEDAPSVPVELAAGELRLEIEAGAVRSVRWRGVEIIRGVALLVRDENWGTLAADGVWEDFGRSDGKTFHYTRHFRVGGGALDCRLDVTGTAAGELAVAARLDARTAVVTNRAGLVLLHPLDGVAGRQATLRTAKGETCTKEFPSLISPDQPMMNISGLEQEIEGIHVAIAFEGEVFEMEDQRNWSDASFKTYCRPLGWPRPYRIKAGDVIEQRIIVRCQGERRAAGKRGSEPSESEGERLPGIALALDASSPLDPALCHLMGQIDFAALQLRVRAGAHEEDLDSALQLLGVLSCPLHLEIVLPEGTVAGKALDQVAKGCRDRGLEPERVIALPAAYLKSHQPAGPWPEGDTPAEVARKVRCAFPRAAVGGGMLTNFTEFNRCPPEPGLVDFVTHGSTAIVHAADDRSVMETIEALPSMFSSTAALAGGKPLHLGLMSIGARTNPYGTGVTPNPDQRRLELAQVDPRQRGLFAASFAVSIIAAARQVKLETLALAMPRGPFGLVHRQEDWVCPFYKGAEGARFFPLFHVVRALAAMAGQRRVDVELPTKGIACVASADAAIVTNHTSQVQEMVVPDELRGMRVRCLDERAFEAATADPEWLTVSPASAPGGRIDLSPYATAFFGRPHSP